VSFVGTVEPLKLFIEKQYDIQVISEIGKKWEEIKTTNTLETESIVVNFNIFEVKSYFEDDKTSISNQSLTIYLKVNKQKLDALNQINQFIAYIEDFTYTDTNFGYKKTQILNYYPIYDDINTVFEINLNIL
jgi:hypothetical protein